jgi:hypothetical protein
VQIVITGKFFGVAGRLAGLSADSKEILPEAEKIILIFQHSKQGCDELCLIFKPIKTCLIYG